MDLPERKRRHHTVWQYYLAAWERDGVVACLRDGRSFSTGTQVLGVRTDFYALKELSPLEEAFVRRFGLDRTEPFVRRLNEGWLNMFLAPFKVRRELESRGVDPTATVKPFEVLESNAEEDLHAEIEARSIEHLNALRADDLRFLQEDGDDRGKFLHYLCVQYFRTPKLQANVVEAARHAPGLRGEHIWPVLRHIYATSMALSLVRKWSELRVSLLRAAPGSEFITSDQPVINLCGVDTPPSEEVTELAFYYPVGPTRALLIDGSREPRFEDPDLTAEQVERLNRDMITMLHEQAFATTEEQLQALIM